MGSSCLFPEAVKRGALSSRSSEPGFRGKLQFLDSLNLPSWTWIAYKGRISFTRDRRVSRDPGPVRSPSSCEFELIDSEVPDIVSALPLEQPASLTIRARIREIPSFSQTVTTYCTQKQTREEHADSSQEISDEHTVMESDFFCAHVSTLWEEENPILAYALILARLRNDSLRFRQVGLAELNHEWITWGEKNTMTLM